MTKSLLSVTFTVVMTIVFAACSMTDSPSSITVDQEVSQNGTKGNSPQSKPVPTVSTSSVTAISVFIATVGGNVSSGSSITSRGICYATSSNPTTANSSVLNGSGTGTFTCVLPGLQPNTLYYARAFATNGSGTGYGSQVTFTTNSTTPNPGTLTDADGNTYATITYGSQTWTVENYQCTHYQNGDAIPEVSDDATWGALTSGALCNYNNSASNVSVYGHLYNWYAVADTRGLAPDGWHIATAAEWETLVNYLGGLNYGGAAAKEAGLSHWNSPNFGATNSAGYNALPGGGRYVNCASCGLTPVVFNGLGNYSPHWTSTLTSSGDANFVELDFNSTRMYRSSYIGGVGYRDKRTGYPVRLIKN